jgi:hypothetical protein
MGESAVLVHSYSFAAPITRNDSHEVSFFFLFCSYDFIDSINFPATEEFSGTIRRKLGWFYVSDEYPSRKI